MPLPDRPICAQCGDESLLVTRDERHTVYYNAYGARRTRRNTVIFDLEQVESEYDSLEHGVIECEGCGAVNHETGWEYEGGELICLPACFADTIETNAQPVLPEDGLWTGSMPATTRASQDETSINREDTRAGGRLSETLC